MICTGCGALLLEDRFMDWSARWRCLSCGTVQGLIDEGRHLDGHQANSAHHELEYCDDEVHLGWEALVRAQATLRTNQKEGGTLPTKARVKVHRASRG